MLCLTWTFTRLRGEHIRLTVVASGVAYIRTKTIKGRDYLYLVRGVREGASVRQKVVRYLGPV